MKRLYVGCRVRIVDDGFPQNDTRPAGREAVIDSAQDWAGRWGVLDTTGTQWWCHPDCLEPILYDGNQLVSWSECLWQPEGQAA